MRVVAGSIDTPILRAIDEAACRLACQLARIFAHQICLDRVASEQLCSSSVAGATSV